MTRQELIRVLLASLEEDTYRAGNRWRAAATAAAALSLGAEGAHTISEPAGRIEGDHPMQRELNRFSVATPPDLPDRDFTVQHTSLQEGQNPDTLTRKTIELRDRALKTRYPDSGGEKLALVIEKFEQRINSELEEVRLPDGRSPYITFSVMERDMKLFRDGQVDPLFHTDRDPNSFDPDSESNDVIGIVIVPMAKSSSTIFDSESQSIVPPDGTIVFFNPLEVHSAPPDINAMYDGVNDQALENRRSIVIGIVQGRDAHMAQEARMADAIAKGFGMGMQATFLQGTTDIQAVEANKEANKIAAIKAELNLDPSLSMKQAVAMANAQVGLKDGGTLAAQVEALLVELGIERNTYAGATNTYGATNVRSPPQSPRDPEGELPPSKQGFSDLLDSEKMAKGRPSMYIIGVMKNPNMYIVGVMLRMNTILPLVYVTFCSVTRALKAKLEAKLEKSKRVVKKNEEMLQYYQKRLEICLPYRNPPPSPPPPSPPPTLGEE